jgi:endonuclease/exonuclease/phosphatase family metal-dependent hydrolase
VSRFTVTAGVLVLPGAVWTVIRMVGLRGGWPFIPLLAFTPYVVPATLVPVAAALVMRQWWVAGVAAAITLVLASLVVPRGFGSPDPANAASGPALRVLTLNMKVGGADPDEIVKLVRDNKVGLLALQEFTPRGRQQLESRGLLDLLPNSSTHALLEPGGSALYSRYPLTDTGYRPLPGDFGQAYATVNVAEAPPLLVESVHPCAPVQSSSLPCWRQGLAMEPRADPAGPVRLLLGDFNSTLDHAPLQALLRSGYRDAAATLGDGFAGTWPYDGTRLPKVTIDHVLADPRIAIRALSAHQVRDTDHRGLYAELRLPSVTTAPRARP